MKWLDLSIKNIEKLSSTQCVLLITKANQLKQFFRIKTHGNALVRNQISFKFGEIGPTATIVCKRQALRNVAILIEKHCFKSDIKCFTPYFDMQWCGLDLAISGSIYWVIDINGFFT